MTTTLTHQDKVLTLTQQPYYDGLSDDIFYRAHAVDEDGNDYDIRWDIVNIDGDDESDACDWDCFSVRFLG